MTVLDRIIRVEMNSHGGVVFHLDNFMIWNRIDGTWGVTGKNNEFLLADGTWGSEGHGFRDPVEALWRAMNWGPEITQEQADIDVYCPVCGSCGESGCCTPDRCVQVKCMYGEDNKKSYRQMETDWNDIYALLAEAKRVLLDTSSTREQALAVVNKIVR